MTEEILSFSAVRVRRVFNEHEAQYFASLPESQLEDQIKLINLLQYLVEKDAAPSGFIDEDYEDDDNNNDDDNERDDGRKNVSARRKDFVNVVENALRSPHASSRSCFPRLGDNPHPPPSLIP